MRRPLAHGNRRGTTLPELIVVIAIMGILLYLAQGVVKAGYDFYRFTDASITLQREGLLALDTISADLVASHQRSVVIQDLTVAIPAPSHAEDTMVVPLPKKLDGTSEIDDQGAVRWMSVAGYAIDTTQPSRPLMRYLGDTQYDPGDDFRPPPDHDYVVDIERVQDSLFPTVAEIAAFTPIGLRAKPIARHLFEFDAKLSVDTINIDITILLPGRVANGQSLDNSLSLKTTVFPRN